MPELYSREMNSAAGSLSTIRSLRGEYRSTDFTETLSMFSFYQCTDPRDRLDALVGRMDDALESL